jgi:phosphate uptake regulator
MGIESPVHIVGNRVVAKTLEEMADSAENIANEVLALKDRKIGGDTILKDISKFSTQVTKISSLQPFPEGSSRDKLERSHNFANLDAKSGLTLCYTQKQLSQAKASCQGHLT